MKLRRALLEESRRAFLLVLRSGAQPEIGGFEGETFGLARLHSLVDGVERISDGERRVADDLAGKPLCGSAVEANSAGQRVR